MIALGKASQLVRVLAKRESYNQGSKCIGFNANQVDFLILHFETGMAIRYSKDELYQANGLGEYSWIGRLEKEVTEESNGEEKEE